ncbi:MAG: NADPH:quinone reductase-like Zn-dependent oxidoreductase [Halioglobus sp.]|jgi:NADPH:quinone reductase-like Zn-dependent oxidoreductase
MNPIPKIMRGVWLTGHGGLDKLEVRNDIPVPQPTANDVIIRVSAAGVNNTDINTRTGWYSKGDAASDDAGWSGEPIGFPRIQGIDVCGTIAAVGENISKERIGERVLVEPCLREVNGETLSQPWFFGSECDGGFAEFTVVASRHAHKIESNLTGVELASFPCSYSTAENMLTRAKVMRGDIVLVTGASGGVGSAAVQLAKARGAEVVAVTSASKSSDLIALGATTTVARGDSLTEMPGQNSIDAVIDLVAGEQFPELLEVLKPGGRYAVAGAIAGPLVDLDVRTLYLKDLSFFGCTALEPEVFPNLIRLIENGSIRPLVAHALPLDQIAKAQETFLEKQYVGKIVLQVDTQ